MNHDDLATLGAIREQTMSVLRSAIGESGDVALLDFPAHMNVGDSMIWAGELAYLGQLGYRVAYACDMARFDAQTLERRVSTGPILLHGGGNFGDVWPEYQEFREEIVRRFPERTIVQLAQSVLFKSAESAARANVVLGGHRNYTLLIRDSASLRRARTQLPDVTIAYCPDLALGWQPPTAAVTSGDSVLVLARRDREARSGLAAATAEVLHKGDSIIDWGLHGPALLAWKAAGIPGKIAEKVPGLFRSALGYSLLAQGYRRRAALNLAAGCSSFEHASLVVTDRLHAHVLAVLMGKDNIVLDNSYGKIRTIYDDYTSKFSTTMFFDSAAGAKERIESLKPA
jgi:pyruvyl transferase EpsO